MIYERIIEIVWDEVFMVRSTVNAALVRSKLCLKQELREQVWIMLNITCQDKV